MSLIIFGEEYKLISVLFITKYDGMRKYREESYGYGTLKKYKLLEAMINCDKLCKHSKLIGLQY